MKRIAEICCGSLEDALIAQKAGADRIELNNAVYLGGLTPSMGTIKLTAENCNIPIVVMVRPRPGGFCYNDYEFKTMISDIEAMGNYNIEGFAFGCLDENRNIDKEKNKTIIISTHYIGFYNNFCDIILEIKNVKIIKKEHTLNIVLTISFLSIYSLLSSYL